jgi:hypothetical protein
MGTGSEVSAAMLERGSSPHTFEVAPIFQKLSKKFGPGAINWPAQDAGRHRRSWDLAAFM